MSTIAIAIANIVNPDAGVALFDQYRVSTAVDNETAQPWYKSNGWKLDDGYLTFECSL